MTDHIYHYMQTNINYLLHPWKSLQIHPHFNGSPHFYNKQSIGCEAQLA